MSSGEVVLETAGLTKSFGPRRAVDGLDLTVRAGEVYGFLGPNGAGKSTTIRMILGLIRPSAGSTRVMGRDVARDRRRALAEVGAQVETPAFYRYLSGRRNLDLLARLSGPVSAQAIADAVELVRLAGREGDKVGTYSQGMRARLGLAQALLPRPRLLILDEPTNGLDPQGMKEVRELVRALARDEGLTVFLSSHLLAEVQQVCDRVAVINYGRLVAEGTVTELLAEHGVCRARVVCEPSERAIAAARAVPGVESVEATEAGLLVRLPEEATAELNRVLVTAGIEVAELARERLSLEQFFLQVTGGAAG